MSDLHKKFSHKAMRELMSFLETYNCETQVLAPKGAGSDPDLKTTGTKAAVIGNVPVNLPAVATIDLSDATVAPDLAGTTIATANEQWWVVMQKADGTTLVAKGSDVTLTSSGAVFKMPDYDPSVYVVIGLVKYVNDSGGDFIIGTTNIDATDCQEHQITGSMFPHIDNWDKN